MKSNNLKGSKMLEVAMPTINDTQSALTNHYSNWIKKSSYLTAGSPGGNGYDLNCGRYLKLDLQNDIDSAVIQALHDKQTTYWDFCSELPVKIAEKLEIENNLTINPDTELVLTCGITPAIDTVLSVFINPGDEVISMDPDFASSYGQIMGRNGVPVIAPSFIEHQGVLDESRWEFDANGLESGITPNTKMILFSNPNNPIGYVYSKEDLENIAAIAKKHDLIVIVNECYERIVHSDEFWDTFKFNSLAAIDGMKDRIITIQGLSKNFHLSGYRIGWVIACTELISMIRFVQLWSTFSVAPTITQYGAAAALTMPLRQDYARKSLSIYKENIDYICNSLGDIPQIECSRPMGGPFCFLDVTNTGFSDEEISVLLYKEGINTIFGTPWGKINGRNHLRLALSNTPEYHRECVDALVKALKKILTSNE